MKKILCAILAIMMIATAVVLTACDQPKATTPATNPENTEAPATTETLKLGLGVYSYYAGATDASEDGNGKGEVITNAAAVLVNKDGKIVKCEIDTIHNVVEYTAEGTFVTSEFKTKYELGYDYNMKNHGAAKEWFEHVDLFETVVVGKTVAEVKALVATGDKGTEEVLNAGCTIKINEFVLAIEKAVANAKDSDATADSTLGLGIASSMSGTDYNAETEANGKIEIDTSIVAMALNANGKVIASVTDCAASEFGFDAAGAATTDTTKALSTKGELGYDYNMKASGAAKEWFEHAAAFDATCTGKNATEIAALATYGVAGEALVGAGCTIYVGNIVKAAVKAATIG